MYFIIIFIYVHNVFWSYSAHLPYLFLPFLFSAGSPVCLTFLFLFCVIQLESGLQEHDHLITKGYTSGWKLSPPPPST